MTPSQPAGWFPDPTQRADQRYWDGTAWTDYVSRAGVQGTDPVVATSRQPVTQPAPVQKKKAKWPWIVGGILAFFILAGAGCAAILGLAVSSAVHHLNAEQRAHAITTAQFDAVPFGATQSAVIHQLGKQPEDSSRFTSRASLPNLDITSSCIYYYRSGSGFGPFFAFCFANDTLNFKHSYG